MSDYLNVFLLDMDEHLQTFETALLNLEKDSYTTEHITVMFRAAHTIKGASAAMGYDPVTELTHRLEDILDRLRSGRLSWNRKVNSLLFLGLDTLSQMRKAIGEQVDPSQVEYGTLLKDLEQLLAPPKMLDGSESKVYEIQIRLHAHVELKAARCCVLLNLLKEYGTIANPPDLDDSDLEFLEIRMISEHSEDEIRKGALDHQDIQEATIKCVAVTQTTEAVVADPTETIEAASIDSGNSIYAPEKKKTSSVRIDVDRLEALMNTLSELVIYQTRNTQVTGEIASRFMGDSSVSELIENTSTMSKVISELQEHVIKTRMQPVETLFRRFPRMIRDISQTLDKDIEFEMEGGETELDRRVLEEIADPLIHILRNALDHGIESRETRFTLNKPPVGKVSVHAAQLENFVILTVRDDGKGMDPDKLRQSAVRKQLMTQEEAERLTDDQAIQLIFAPGFSTAREVTDISGRGIGMDIVRAHIEKLNGVIQIESVVGQGTNIEIRLPLTMAIIRGILFKLGSRTFALPMSNVLEIIHVQEGGIEWAAGQEVLQYRSGFIPVKWIHEEFDIPDARFIRSGSAIKFIVLGVSEKRFAIAVTELIGFQDIVVKPISEQVKKKDIVSNATILGNGNVALILDAVGMYKSITRGILM
jgi:two-component system, chemotaxis family, sensor kinase CheA